MYYLMLYSKLAWRVIVVMMGASAILEHGLGITVNSMESACFFLLFTSFIAWVWFCKRVIEVKAEVVEMEENDEEVPHS